MTLSGAQVLYKAGAVATPTGTGVSGKPFVGQDLTPVNFSDGDVVQVFTVESTGAGDVATLDLDEGSVAQTNGTPTITDGDGKDFEGEDIAMPTLYALLIESADGNTGTVTVANTLVQMIDVTIRAGTNGSTFLHVVEDGLDMTGYTMAMTFSAGGDSVTVTLIGKSS